MSALIAITCVSSFAAQILVQVLLRREPRQVVLCDPLQRQAVIDLARSELGSEPQVSLHNDLEPTIAWFR